MLTLLTVLHLCDDRIRVQWFANTKFVDSRDSELVLVAFNKVCGIVRASFTFGGDHCPGYPRCLSLFHHIVSDGGTAVVLWWVPPHGALLSCDTGETDGTLNRSRGICRNSQGEELLKKFS